MRLLEDSQESMLGLELELFGEEQDRAILEDAAKDQVWRHDRSGEPQAVSAVIWTVRVRC